jgi:hypothetical protein
MSNPICKRWMSKALLPAMMLWAMRVVRKQRRGSWQLHVLWFDLRLVCFVDKARRHISHMTKMVLDIATLTPNDIANGFGLNEGEPYEVVEFECEGLHAHTATTPRTGLEPHHKDVEDVYVRRANSKECQVLSLANLLGKPIVVCSVHTSQSYVQMMKHSRTAPYPNGCSTCLWRLPSSPLSSSAFINTCASQTHARACGRNGAIRLIR